MYCVVCVQIFVLCVSGFVSIEREIGGWGEYALLLKGQLDQQMILSEWVGIYVNIFSNYF